LAKNRSTKTIIIARTIATKSQESTSHAKNDSALLIVIE
jgi:hypothetical protein